MAYTAPQNPYSWELRGLLLRGEEERGGKRRERERREGERKRERGPPCIGIPLSHG